MTTVENNIPTNAPTRSESTMDNTGAITQVSSSTTSSTSASTLTTSTCASPPTYHPASPLKVSSWHSVLTSVEGRDKLFRLMQYVCRLLRGVYLGRRTPSTNGSTPLTGVYALEGALSLTRQVSRMFKWVSIYAKVGQEGFDKNMLKIIADCALAAYYAADNWTVLCKTGLVKRNPTIAARRAGRLWLIAVLASLTSTAVEYKRNVALEGVVKAFVGRTKKQEEEGPQQPSEQRKDNQLDLRRIRRERRILSAVLAKHSADSVVAMSLSKVDALHPALVGACGGLSSIIGFWQTWPKVVQR